MLYNIIMTNKELIKKLSEFPGDSEVDFCLFSNLTPQRCDVSDSHVMIRRSPHSGLVYVMLDLEEHWEHEIVDRIKSEIRNERESGNGM